MPITHKDIASCNSITLDLSLQSFANGGAEIFSKAFKENELVQRLMLSDSVIIDDEFVIIAQAIIDRNISLKLLDLDYNTLLTPNIMPMLVTLIEKKLIENLSLYRVNEIVNSRDCHRQLSELAQKGLVVVFNMNPIEKKKQHPTLFNPRSAVAFTQDGVIDKYPEERKEASELLTPGRGLTGH
jgi:Ran GTPase-activating protein (RanGAP) involved in mRNA processing and transport